MRTAGSVRAPLVRVALLRSQGYRTRHVGLFRVSDQVPGWTNFRKGLLRCPADAEKGEFGLRGWKLYRLARPLPAWPF